LLKPWYHKY